MVEHREDTLLWRYGGPVYDGAEKVVEHPCFAALRAPLRANELARTCEPGAVLIDRLAFHVPDEQACREWYEFLKDTPILKHLGEMDSDGWVSIDPDQPAFNFLNSLNFLRIPIKNRCARAKILLFGAESTFMSLMMGKYTPDIYWSMYYERPAYLSSFVSGDMYEAVLIGWPNESVPYSVRGSYQVVLSDWMYAIEGRLMQGKADTVYDTDMVRAAMNGTYPHQHLVQWVRDYGTGRAAKLTRKIA